MENKKTTELLDLLHDHESKEDYGEEYDAVRDELVSREPFYSLLRPRDGDTVSEELECLEDDIKKLKRHKHDTNGDVLIRI